MYGYVSRGCGGRLRSAFTCWHPISPLTCKAIILACTRHIRNVLLTSTPLPLPFLALLHLNCLGVQETHTEIETTLLKNFRRAIFCDTKFSWIWYVNNNAAPFNILQTLNFKTKITICIFHCRQSLFKYFVHFNPQKSQAIFPQRRPQASSITSRYILPLWEQK